MTTMTTTTGLSDRFNIDVAPPPRPLSSFMTLMYHNVGPRADAYADLSPSMTSYFVTCGDFEAQLTELQACGGSPITFEEFEDFYRPSGDDRITPDNGASHPVLLTFDDGWADGVDFGSPILWRHHCQAFLFITTDFLDRPHFLSRRELAHLDTRIFRVGSHARTHRMLSLLDESEIRAELSDSRKLLEDLTGGTVDSLSIPSGAVDRRVRRIAAECGYRFVFDSDVRVNHRGQSPMAIGRVALMHDTDLPTFRQYVGQHVTRERVRRVVLQMPKRLLGLRRYERLRRRLLGETPNQYVTHES
jgi:peptidoglycan/xylan/chitin deacetylase (PgdA/CDA1 family)